MSIPLRSILAPLLAPATIVAACASPPSSSGPTSRSPSTPPAPREGDAGHHPPVAKRVPHPTDIHGHRLVDDYFWMRDKGAPDVIGYLEAENAYTEAVTKPLEPLVQRLYDEMLARVKQDDDTPPVKDGPFRYYKRFETGKQYPIYCRKAVTGPATESVILDVNELAKNEAFVDVTNVSISDDHTRLAYQIDTAGFRQYRLKVKDLRSNATLAESIERVDGSAWAADGRTIFYVTEDPQTKRANKLFRHVLGASKDELVYEETDEHFALEVDRTRDKAYIVVTSASHTTSETRVIDASKPTTPARLVAPREPDHEYYVDHRQGTFYIRTNSGSRNFRLVTAPASDPRRDKWKELVAARADTMLENVTLFADYMVLTEHRDALPRFSVYDFKTKQIRPIPQPEAVYDVAEDDNPEFGASSFRFRFESPITPRQIVEEDLATGKRTILKTFPVLGYDAGAYETKRLLVPARDGTKVPVSLAYKKGVAPDRSRAMLLSGYGAYGISGRLRFSSTDVSLLDRGVVVAYAHVRGGGDMGKVWHDQGRMEHKLNTFTDFIDVSQAMVDSGWAAKDRLTIAGGSAGGLLMGAVVNMRPELFRLAFAYVPFVDVINTMLDESLPLTVGEFEEWGNPKTRDAFEYMMRYSPYDNVKAQSYPAMLVRTSYNDSQVMYWEPAKWVARLRATKTDQKPLLLKTAMEPAGHGGKSGRFDRLRDSAFDYALLLSTVGLEH